MVALRVPLATYRLQLNRSFRFEDAHGIVPYLNRLGISDLYASPIVKARRGSPHGYDVTNPSRFNPDLGSEEQFEALVGQLRAHRMGLILDIVPNHMAASPENPWWMDMLEHGRSSTYAIFFDIDWNPTGGRARNKVVLPILGTPYREALENQELALTLEDDGLFLRYRAFRLPLNVKSYGYVASHDIGRLETALGVGHPTFQQFKKLIDAARRLPSSGSFDPAQAVKRKRKQQAIKEDLTHLIETSAGVKAFLMENITLFNGREGDHGSFDLLDRLMHEQAYRLTFWKTKRREINYRRFFDIDDLIGVRIEMPEVFEARHALIFRLVDQGAVTGLRVDHVDGLYDPFEYLCRLQRRLAPQASTGRPPGFYVVVEKILASDEALPDEWPVFGTTGYDFLNATNALFVDRRSAGSASATYRRFTGSSLSFNDVVYEKKKRVIEKLFAGEVRALGHQLERLAQQVRSDLRLSHRELTRALTAVTACLPVYRTYARTIHMPPQERFRIERAFAEAKRRDPGLEARASSFLREVLLLHFPADASREQQEAWLRFAMRWQQFTGPVTAKGLEDTALYTYNRLTSLNEVGGDPGGFGLSLRAFHQRSRARQVRWPYTMNATSTHDTKRGEDVRARLNVLSEIPRVWAEHLAKWQQWNQAKKQTVHGQPVPEPEMETLIYQTLIGAWPLSQEEVPEFVGRFKAYVLKASRESKVFTSWLSPDSAYENALLAFVEALLQGPEQDRFLNSLLRFHRRVAYYGALNSLSQVLLKAASPGVPDFYQGTEVWSFSLVDPDNRRRVDFRKREEMLDDIIRQEARGQESLAQRLLASWQDGRIKLYTTYKSLNVRRTYSDLFSNGVYIPLYARGRKRQHVCAFARRLGNTWAVVAVPRLLARLVHEGTLPLGPEVWHDDVLPLPEAAPERWVHAFTGESVNTLTGAKEIPLSKVFHRFPVALLLGRPQEVTVFDEA